MGSEVVFEPFLESPVDAWPQSQVGHYLRFNYTIISPRNKVMLSKLQKQLKLWKKSCIDKIFDNFIYYLDIQLYTNCSIFTMFTLHHGLEKNCFTMVVVLFLSWQIDILCEKWHSIGCTLKLHNKLYLSSV